MKIVWSCLSALITIALIFVLNIRLPVAEGKTPRLGYFLSPQKGFWQNAETDNIDYTKNLKLHALKGNVDVYLDDRLVPHIYADDEDDAFFAQGYLHAKFRLWQMDFQSYAAGGRLSEIMGAKSNGTDFLAIDKYFRRLGMVYGAEKSLEVAEADAATKNAMDAYTAGVNAYINSLQEDDYPIEYKLLDYKPEQWTNLKTCLFLQYMRFDLSGYDNDFEMTNAKSVFTKLRFQKLFPYYVDSTEPIYPKGTVFAKQGIPLKVPADADSVYFNFKDTINFPVKAVMPNKNNGSNNWAVSGTKTKSGRPILCSDPHLDLNLPSLWYEVQISTPTYNAYGASFPGSPGVIIGFNDNCAFGFTNSERDVKDYYKIKFKDSTMQYYWFNSAWQQTQFRNEIIKIKNGINDTEHIALTVFGPVMYDANYANKLKDNKAYAVRWTANDGSNELKTFLLLDKAKNYDDYVHAISTFYCPGQNMIFACKSGDIAIKQQGGFAAKWRGQGDFVMPGTDSSYMWKIIPDSENLVLHNPARGFISSANQMPYDTAYPYYFGLDHYEYFRGKIINRYLSFMQNITADNMKKMQTDNYNLMAEMARPFLLKYINENDLNEDGKRYLNIFKQWNLRNDAGEFGPSIFTSWFDSLKVNMYSDDVSQNGLQIPTIAYTTLIKELADSVHEFADNINTPGKETINDVVTQSFKQIIPVMQAAEKSKNIAWGKFKQSGIKSLLNIPAFSRRNLYAGGGEHIINAFSETHGPSWRMIVELTDKTSAYGVYPGGQNGNPGSKYFDNFINTWAAGKYFKLTIVSKKEISQQSNLKGKISFTKL